jgi:hypothetical protein
VASALAEAHGREWGHVALDFALRLRLLLEATAIGLAEALPPGDGG